MRRCRTSRRRSGSAPSRSSRRSSRSAKAHASEGDTVTTAAQATGLPQDKLNEIVGHIGGEGALGRFASLMKEDGGIMGSIKSFL